MPYHGELPPKEFFRRLGLLLLIAGIFVGFMCLVMSRSDGIDRSPLGRQSQTITEMQGQIADLTMRVKELENK